MDFLLSFIGISILVVVVLLLLTSCVKIVPQAQSLVVERLGAIWIPGLWASILKCPSSTGWQSG